mgnify:CR=1
MPGWILLTRPHSFGYFGIGDPVTDRLLTKVADVDGFTNLTTVTEVRKIRIPVTIVLYFQPYVTDGPIDLTFGRREEVKVLFHTKMPRSD